MTMAERPLTDPEANDPEATDPAATDRARGPTDRRSDLSPVAWLLLVPVVLVLWPPLFNSVRPTLFGIPFFYWYQLAVIPIGVLCTALVYRMTTPRGGRS
jgi:hypothetical protein